MCVHRRVLFIDTQTHKWELFGICNMQLNEIIEISIIFCLTLNIASSHDINSLCFLKINYLLGSSETCICSDEKYLARVILALLLVFFILRIKRK